VFNPSVSLVPDISSTKTTVKIQIIIPTMQKVLFFTNYIETVITSWIEYLALFIILYVLLFKVLIGFIMRTKIFEVFEINDLPKEHLERTPL